MNATRLTLAAGGWLLALATMVHGERVAVLPFEAVGAEASQAWVGQAVQQSLVAELSRVGGLDPKAIATADEAEGEFVLTGSYQIVDGQTRLTGQIVRREGNAVVGGLKATGPMRDLFSLQDTLAEQAKRALTAATAPETTQPTAAGEGQGTPAQAGPTIIINNAPYGQGGVLPGGQYTGSHLQFAVESRYSPSRLYREPEYTRVYDRYRYGDRAWFGFSYPSFAYYPGWYGNHHHHGHHHKHRKIIPSVVGETGFVRARQPGNSLGPGMMHGNSLRPVNPTR